MSRKSFGEMQCAHEQRGCTCKSETTTTSTTLSAGRVGGDGGNVLDAANAHAGTGKSAESGLGTRAGGLGAGTTGGTELDVKGGDADLLAADGAVLSGQHGSVRRGLVTVGLDLHTTYWVTEEKGAGEIRLEFGRHGCGCKFTLHQCTKPSRAGQALSQSPSSLSTVCSNLACSC